MGHEGVGENSRANLMSYENSSYQNTEPAPSYDQVRREDEAFLYNQNHQYASAPHIPYDPSAPPLISTIQPNYSTIPTTYIQQVILVGGCPVCR